MGSNEWILYFPLPVKLSLSQSMNFFTFTPSNSLPHPTRGEWVSEQLLTKVNSQHRQNGTLQMIKMQTSACWRQWVEIWQLIRQCAGQGRAGRNKEGVGRKPITTVSQHTHHCKSILSSHCHCFSFSLLLTIYMNKRFIAPLTSMSLEKKNQPKPRTSDHNKLLSRRNSQSHLGA